MIPLSPGHCGYCRDRWPRFQFTAVLTTQLSAGPVRMPSPRPVPVLNPREIIGVLLANSASLEYLPATSHHLALAICQPNRISSPLRSADCRRPSRRRGRRTPLQRATVRARPPGPPHRFNPIREPALRSRLRTHRSPTRRPRPARSPHTLPSRPRRRRRRLGPRRLQRSIWPHRAPRRATTVLTTRTLRHRKGAPPHGGAFAVPGRADVSAPSYSSPALICVALHP